MDDKKEIKRIPTTEVMTRLIKSENFQTLYADNIDTLQLPKLSEYLSELCEQKEITSYRLFQEVDIDNSAGYKYFSGERRLSRDNALKLAFGLNLDIEETQQLLTISKNSRLYPFIPRDAAILYCLHNKINYRETQEHLFEWNMTVLGDEKRYDKPDD